MISVNSLKKCLVMALAIAAVPSAANAAQGKSKSYRYDVSELQTMEVYAADAQSDCEWAGLSLVGSISNLFNCRTVVPVEFRVKVKQWDGVIKGNFVYEENRVPFRGDLTVKDGEALSNYIKQKALPEIGVYFARLKSGYYGKSLYVEMTDASELYLSPAPGNIVITGEKIVSLMSNVGRFILEKTKFIPNGIETANEFVESFIGKADMALATHWKNHVNAVRIRVVKDTPNGGQETVINYKLVNDNHASIMDRSGGKQ